MPNAGDLTQADAGAPAFLLVGGPGSGKTTLIRTLPGRTFVFMFDPRGLSSLKGAANIEYQLFTPDRLDMGVKTLAGNKPSDTSKALAPIQFPTFYNFFEEKDDEGYFDQFDNLVLDSATTLTSAIMDRVLYHNGRAGKHPEYADNTAAMTAFAAVVRNMTALRKVVLFTAHNMPRTDNATGKTTDYPHLIGQLRVTVPLLFSDIFFMESDQADGKRQHLMNTVGERHRQYVRCSLPGLDSTIDVTMTGDMSPEYCAKFPHGLGALYNLKAKEWQEAA